jgi:hypothetical protein
MRNCPGRAADASLDASTFILHIVGVSISFETILYIDLFMISVYHAKIKIKFQMWKTTAIEPRLLMVCNLKCV